MYRRSVLSSNLASVGYDPNTQILEVEFFTGSIYQYSGIPPSLYSSLMLTSSHGLHLDEYVKKAGYAYWKVV
ncbi:MAG: KTSC domain-containing protein [Synechococcales cyanobacterium K44_A2020_017]|nr:KTSC domain-containing protein [Synechococcales cyanobacterium K32_A2020_035]MBF2094874.1 KTSC domain-containing protein [Synechococcales cyanobacterium K44_A2020_017]